MTSTTVAPFAQHNRVIAVEPARPIGLIGLGQDRRISGRLRHDEHVPIRHRAGQIDGQASSGTAVEIHLDVITAGRQVNGRAGAIVDF